MKIREFITLQQVKDEITQMNMVRQMQAEERYYILEESGIPEFLYEYCNGSEESYYILEESGLPEFLYEYCNGAASLQ